MKNEGALVPFGMLVFGATIFLSTAIFRNLDPEFTDLGLTLGHTVIASAGLLATTMVKDKFFYRLVAPLSLLSLTLCITNLVNRVTPLNLPLENLIPPDTYPGLITFCYILTTLAALVYYTKQNRKYH